MKALTIAATGMNAQQLNLEVIANNIANINTTGFKRARAEFTDLLYQTQRMQGVPNQGGQSVIPEGVRQGLGVRAAAIRNLHLQGGLTLTGNTYDMAIDGRGWFQVDGPNGETLYTRAGAFNKNADGQLVTLDGYAVQPAIIVPTDATDLTVNESGEIFATVPGQAAPQSLGQLSLANFTNDVGLEPIGGNLYRETAASAAPQTGEPGVAGAGSIRQGCLEGSNVSTVQELVDMIETQRAYEVNAKVISAADEMQKYVNQSV